MSNIVPQRYRRRSRYNSDQESLTEQCHKDKCRIQNILARHVATGVLDHVNQTRGLWEDMTLAPDFTEAQNIVASAMSMFENVPSHIRDAMNNDPATYMEFMQNPENIEEIEEFGLDSSHLTPPEVTPDPSTPAIPETPSPATPDVQTPPD